MGEARRRKLHQPLQPLPPDVVLVRVSTALRKLALAASGSLGGDCYMHAAIAQALLAEQGIPTQITVGFAAWRVGDADGDVISHFPQKGVSYPTQTKPFHVWLTLAGQVLDFTTYQLRLKAQQLDAQDGGCTTVSWCPDYLFVPRSACASYAAVARENAGVFAYDEHPELRSYVLAVANTLDQADLAAARLIYRNPDMYVQGPNDRLSPAL